MLHSCAVRPGRAFAGAARGQGCGTCVAQLGGSFPSRTGSTPHGNRGAERERDLSAKALQTPAVARQRVHPPVDPYADLLLEKRLELEESWGLETVEPEHETSGTATTEAAAQTDMLAEARSRAQPGASTSGRTSSKCSTHLAVDASCTDDPLLCGTTRPRGELRRRPSAASSTSARRRLTVWRAAAAAPPTAAAADAPATAAGGGLRQHSQPQQDAAYLAAVREQLRSGRRRRAGSQSDSVSMFLVSLGNTAVLSREQEMQLCAILQRGVRLERAAVALQRQLERLPTIEEVAEAGGLASPAEVKQVVRNRAEAEDLMVQHNMRLVFSVCKRYLNRGVELSDLLMDGVAGMRRALLRFDPGKGFKFSTYCHWWIRQAVTRSINEQSRTVRLPQHTTEALTKVLRAAEVLSLQTAGAEPASHQELAQAVGMAPDRLISLLRVAGPNDNLPAVQGALKELPMDEIMGLELGADSGGTEAGSIASDLDRSVVESLRYAFDLVIATLPKRERNIMRLYMGLVPLGPMAAPGVPAAAAASQGAAFSTAQGAGLAGAPHASEPVLYAPPLTLSELAEVHGLGKERIRQIYDKALMALRRPWRQQLLRELIGLPQTPLPVECCGSSSSSTGASAGAAVPGELWSEGSGGAL